MRRAFITAGLVILFIITVIAFFILEGRLRKPAVQRGNIESVKKHLVQQLQEKSEQKRFGAAALVLIERGRIAGEYGFGIAHPNTNSVVKTDQTLFLLASVSKAVTAWGVMKLVQDNKIGLDEPVMKHLKRWRFPGSEANSSKVTVRHLLSHTAGIDDGFGFSGFALSDSMQTLVESLEFPRDANMGKPHPARIVREPGQSVSYSSAGYSILQLLIEDITGKPFNDYIKEAVLHPLGMSRSDFDIEEIIAGGRSNDLAANYDVSLKPHPFRRYANMGAASLRTTAHDMALFISAYNGNNVLTKETIKQMVTPQPGTSGTWGLGHELISENGTGGFIAGHGGGAFPRTGASMQVNPETGNGIAIMMTGGEQMLNPFINDWIYWETGKTHFDIRDVIHNRYRIALVIIAIGAALIIFFRSKRTKYTAR